MTLTNTQKTRYTNPALAKSSVRIGLRFSTGDISTPKSVFFHVDKHSRLSTSKKRVFMMGCLGVSQDTPFPVCGKTNPTQLITSFDWSLIGDEIPLSIQETVMSNLISFNFQTSQVRTIVKNNGDVYFCLPDVANILDIKNSRDILAKQLNKAGVEKIYISHESGKKQITFINEPNLYRVIFRSNKPEAVKFQDWVFEEVLPSIRKTGNYQSQNQELYQICSGSLNYLMDYVKTLHNLNTVAHSDVLLNQKQFAIQQIHAIIAYCHKNNINTPTGKPIFANGELNFIGGNSVAYGLPMLRLAGLVNY